MEIRTIKRKGGVQKKKEQDIRRLNQKKRVRKTIDSWERRPHEGIVFFFGGKKWKPQKSDFEPSIFDHFSKIFKNVILKKNNLNF